MITIRKILIFILILFFPFFILASDYTQNCTSTGSCSCKLAGAVCKILDPNSCIRSNTCSFSCPNPIKNSSYVSNVCLAGKDHTCECGGGFKAIVCGGEGTCFCLISGNCSYDCNEGYQWNEETQTCEIIPTPTPPPITGQEILDNSFFAFWHFLGENFIFLLAFILIISIVIAYIYILTKR